MNKHSSNNTVGRTIFYYLLMLLKSIAAIIGITIFGTMQVIGFMLWKTGGFVVQKLIQR